ncbi:MAG: hypothetical protein ALMCE001_03690 [Methanocorpusculum sp. MCE]|nr:MAG: hypothetical protein ALMCE001_03690 [Methanocorpusculum sp. MCE]
MTRKKAFTTLITVFLLLCLLTGAVCASSTAVETAVDKGLDYLAAHQNPNDAGNCKLSTSITFFNLNLNVKISNNLFF